MKNRKSKPVASGSAHSRVIFFKDRVPTIGSQNNQRPGQSHALPSLSSQLTLSQLKLKSIGLKALGLGVVLGLSLALLSSAEASTELNGSTSAPAATSPTCSSLVVSVDNSVASAPDEATENESFDLQTELQSYLKVFKPLDRGQAGALEVLSLFFQNRYESRFENELNAFMMRPTDVVRVVGENARVKNMLNLANEYSSSVQELNQGAVDQTKKWYQRIGIGQKSVDGLNRRTAELARQFGNLKSEIEEGRSSYLDYVEQASSHLKKLDDHSQLVEQLVMAIDDRISSLSSPVRDAGDASLVNESSASKRTEIRILRWENLLGVIAQKMSRLVEYRENLFTRMKSSELGWQVTSQALETVKDVQILQRFATLSGTEQNSKPRVFDKDGNEVIEDAPVLARGKEKRSSIFDLMRPVKTGEIVLLADPMEANGYKRLLGDRYAVLDPVVFTPIAGVLVSPLRLINFAFRWRRTFTLEFFKVRVREIGAQQYPVQKVPRAYLALTDPTINWMGLKVDDVFQVPEEGQWVIAGFTYYGAVLARNQSSSEFHVFSVTQIKRYINWSTGLEKK